MNTTISLTPIIITPLSIAQNIPFSAVKAPFDDPSKPIAPLVTAVYVKDALIFRIVVFIDSSSTKEPIFSVDKNNSDFYVQYDFKEELPTSYTAWYIYVSYISTYINTITVYNSDIDPKTSRGTETTVQQATM